MKVGYGAYCGLLGGGGVYAYMHNLLRALAADYPDFEAVLWYGYFRGKNLHPTDFGLPRVKWTSTRLPKKLVSRMWKWFGRPSAETLAGPVDVFHGIHFELPPSKKIPLVLTVHDVIAKKHPELADNPAVSKYNMEFELPNSLRRADRIICVSECTRRDLAECYPFAAEKTAVLHHGRDENIRRVADEEIIGAVLKKFKIERPYVFYPAGSVVKRKNIPLAIRAFNKMRGNTKSDASLAISGVGAFPADAAAAIKECKLENRVISLRYDSESEYSALLSAAEFAIYPSLYEGFGLPVLEAMSCGTPLVASSTSSIPEVAGDAAILVDPADEETLADAMARLWNSNALRTELGAKGLKQAEKFNWSACASQTMSIYKELL
jgi:glycosyltransferase involved in cell wall biosynthesis